MNLYRLLPGLLVCLGVWGLGAAAGPVAADSPPQEEDLWYVLMLGEQRAGHAHITMGREGDRLVSDVAIEMKIRRGQMTLQIAQISRFVESLAGEPIEASSVMKMGTMAVTQTMRFTDTGRVLESEQNGVTQQRQLPPIDGPWLTPGRMVKQIEQALDRGDPLIRVRSLDLLLGPEPYTTEYRLVGPEAIEVFGKTVPATAWRVTLSAMPGVEGTQYLDAQGNLVRQSVQLAPGMDVQMLLADRSLAEAQVTPPEMMADTLVTPSRPIDNPRRADRGVYRLTLAGGEPFDGVELPRTGAQRVSWGDQTTAVVLVDLAEPNAPGADVPGEEHLRASATLNHQDPAVAALAASVRQELGPDADAHPDPTAMAAAARRFVHAFVQAKDLSVGFATASEVARTRQGDCSEHAVLLAALLRGLGVPSRTVSGLVYVDRFLGREGVFGYHMWTQAWIGGRWVDLDATLPGDRAFDATHIALNVSALADDGLINDMVALLPLLGRLEVEVVTVEGE